MSNLSPGDKEPANVFLDLDKCNGCGLCVDVCTEFSFQIVNQKVEQSDALLLGCVACGHCMMICPTGVIAIEGRSLSPIQLFNLPEKSTVPNYESLLALFQRRRSIFKFRDEPVAHEKINKILEAAQTAPNGTPPSEVHVLVLENKLQVQAFADEFSKYLSGISWMASNWALTLMRPFLGKSNYEMLQGYLKPALDGYVDSIKKGENRINFNAPLAMYFYVSPGSDPTDPIIAATYAMLTGESLGLGTCIVGTIHPFIQKGRKARLFRENYGIKYPSREGMFVIFGYTDVNYKKGVKRVFADINRIK